MEESITKIFKNIPDAELLIIYQVVMDILLERNLINLINYYKVCYSNQSNQASE